MNADSFFVTGHTHTVCQDYAEAGRTRAPPHPMPDDMGSFQYMYAIVSDGCSTSPNTDFGSRFLVREAVSELTSRGSTRAPRIEPFRIAERAEAHLDRLGLSGRALDATLLTVHEQGAALFAQVWGDGVVAARRRDGTLDIFQVEYPKGAPLYLNYWNNYERLKGFLLEFGSHRKVTQLLPDGISELLMDTSHRLDRVGDLYCDERCGSCEFPFPQEAYDVVAVMSDGVQSFRRRKGNGFEPVPVQEVVAKMMAFKNYTGEFVVRRMKAFLKQATADGWHWDDDVSMAAIHVGDVL